MSTSFSFDLADDTSSDDRARIRLALIRCGWDHVGGSTWRYPAHGAQDDYLNQAVPALHYFNSLVSAHCIRVTKYHLDVSTSIAFSADGGYGYPIATAASRRLVACDDATESKLSERRFRKFCEASEQDLGMALSRSTEDVLAG